MKTILKYSLMMFAAVLGVACNGIKESAESVSFPEKKIVLTATREGLAPGTRSFRLDDGSVWWSPNEEVSVFYGAGSNGGSKFVSMNSAIAETVELQGSVQMAGSGKDFWAVYPYSEGNSCDGSSIITVIPDQQTGVEGNFSNDVFPTVAKSSSLSLAFWNICGGVKFFVSRNDIKSVTFKGNNNEVLAGTVKVSFGSDGTPVIQEVIDAKSEVTLVAPDGGTFKVGKYYYITLLPAELRGGITMVFETDNTVGTLVSDKAQTVKRSVFGVLKNIDSKVSEWETVWVDLGLSVKWATCNVGADKPSEYGDYFAWGEVQPKSDYTWSTYKWCNGSSNTQTKYNINSLYGTVDNKIVLDHEDDAACINLGDGWRMPTYEEWTELINNCTWTWTDDYEGTGVSGKIVTSNKSGYTDKSIFLPAAGDFYDGGQRNFGTNGFYWSSLLNTDSSAYASYVFFNSNSFRLFRNYRYVGKTIRPVYGEFIPVASITLDNISLELFSGTTKQLTATISPTNATNPSVRWASADESVARVDENGIVLAVAKGTTTVSAYASNGLSSSCEVTVTQATAEPEAVDLGLSVKWATFNVGATKPEEYGDYFAWGEIEPKSDYRWSTYKWCNGSYNTLTKYNTDSSYGTVDNKTVLDLEDDAAHVNWGGSWRMPTLEEIEELHENCSIISTNRGGINGYEVVSSVNGNSIFLPYNDNSSIDGVKTGYWCSSLLYNRYAYRYQLSSYSWRNNAQRAFGCQIRPVYGEYIPVESIILNEKTLDLNLEDSYQLEATIIPTNAFAREICWVSSNEQVVIVDDDGLVIPTGVGSATIYAYGSNGLYGSCNVRINLQETTMPSPQAVDLGLSVKWALSNVGASRLYELGELFSWGETTSKSTNSWSTYKWCNGTQNTLTKYNTMPDYGIVDNKTILDPEDDAAYHNWKGRWRMPTSEEIQEIVKMCRWVPLRTDNDIVAYRAISKITGNSIIFPRMSGKSYLSSSLIIEIPYCCCGLGFNQMGGRLSEGLNRCNQWPVRPVLASTEVTKVVFFDFNRDEVTIPEGGGTYIDDGNVLTLFATNSCSKDYSRKKGFLSIGKMGSYIEFPAIAGKSLIKVEFLTGNALSENVITDIAKADGTRLNINNDKLKKGTYYAWEVPGEPGAAYRIVVANPYNAQFQNLTLIYE